jgi:LPLT family lysophospholipid transporter-like MFS transporter
MNRGQRRTLSLVVFTQFLGGLADNALLIVAIALLTERHTAGWTIPALRIVFYAASLLLAPLAGRFADGWPKGRVIFIGSLAKFIGCALLVGQIHPLLAYALVGISAAAYGPAKYGILPEFLSANDLVSGNAWMEISTVLSILIGVGLSSFLLTNDIVAALIPQGSIALHAAGCILIVYAMSALTALSIPSTRFILQRVAAKSSTSLQQFYLDQRRLWCDREGGIAMAVTCLFWAVAAGLQFVVLRWGQEVAHLSPGQSALLQLPVALGLVAGAAAAGQWIRLSAVHSYSSPTNTICVTWSCCCQSSAYCRACC